MTKLAMFIYLFVFSCGLYFGFCNGSMRIVINFLDECVYMEIMTRFFRVQMTWKFTPDFYDCICKKD